jgi:hypothetical protein
MSITHLSAEPNAAVSLSTSTSRSGARAETGRSGARWVRLALVCAIVAGSGAVRWWQARRVEAVLRDGRTAPFPLHELPMVVGSWRGQQIEIDPRIARRTGATDLITRRYVDQRTGATLEAIILYGPSTEVYGHVPEVCYKAAGFDKVAGPEARSIRVGNQKVPFRTLVYTRGEGGEADLHEVCYSWRYSDHWSPEVVSVYKRFERIPGMLKVHVTRRISERERRDIGNPGEAFLEALLPELERRLPASMTPLVAPRGRSPEGDAR